jgi:hypothetical protein
LLLIVAIGSVGATQPPLVSFLLTIALLAAFTTVAGHGVVGFWLGLLIDERNRMSLSRLQMCLWTIVVLSGFLSAALWNILQSNDPRNPMIAVAIPQELWLAMGISVTSLVGSPLVLSTKMTAPADATVPAQRDQIQKEEERTKEELARQGLPAKVVIIQGKVVVWKWLWDARPADLFQGDEIGNAAHLDLGKVQMLLFTLVLVFAYAVMMAHGFTKVAGTPDAILSLPRLSEGMVALLGISHAGYLTNKAVPHSVAR